MPYAHAHGRPLDVPGLRGCLLGVPGPHSYGACAYGYGPMPIPVAAH